MPQKLKNREASVQQKGFTLSNSTIYRAPWIGAALFLKQRAAALIPVEKSLREIGL